MYIPAVKELSAEKFIKEVITACETLETRKREEINARAEEKTEKILTATPEIPLHDEDEWEEQHERDQYCRGVREWD